MSPNEINLDTNTQKNVSTWLAGHYDEKTKAEIRRLQKEDPKTLIDAFSAQLEFGTAGLRGVMGVGSNRMNDYTVRAATQGLANYINRQPKQKIPHSVLIGCDSRHHSRHFSEEASRVLAANGIKVYLYKDIRPVPLVSFGCRYKKCTAAIMITASHNPPEYNGYKAYWGDGAQVLPPHDQGIIDEVNKITDPTQVKMTDLTSPLIEMIDDEIDKAYIQAIRPLQHYPKENKASGGLLNVIYTSLHGAGITMVPSALADWGFSKVDLVEKQCIPDGNFPTAPSPNPEEKAALQMGIDQLIRGKRDLLIGTDPDTDRVGVAVLHEGQAILLNGNEIACVCLYHVCSALASQGRMPEKAAFIKTIVTTELFRAITDGFHRPCFDVLTGFKYIGEQIRHWEEGKDGYQYIFGGEESYGYLLGTHARDKDAVIACCLICEAALHAKQNGKTLIDVLQEIYRKFGIYREKLLSLTYKGAEGQETIKGMMAKLRMSPPSALLGIPVISLEDYQKSTRFNLETKTSEPLSLPKSNVLLLWLKDGTKVVIRPSGTEPKIKVYCGGVQKQFRTLEEGIAQCDSRNEQLAAEIRKMMSDE